MSLTTTPPYWRLTSDKCRMPAPPQCSITGLYQFVFYTISGGHHFPPKRKDDRLPWLRSPSLLYAAKSFETLFFIPFLRSSPTWVWLKRIVKSDLDLFQCIRKTNKNPASGNCHHNTFGIASFSYYSLVWQCQRFFYWIVELLYTLLEI